MNASRRGDRSARDVPKRQTSRRVRFDRTANDDSDEKRRLPRGETPIRAYDFGLVSVNRNGRATPSRIEKPRAMRYDIFGVLRFPMNPNGWCRDWITSRQVPVTPSGGALSGESARDVASSGTVASLLLSREGRARIAEVRSGGTSGAEGCRTAGSFPAGNLRSRDPRSRPPERAARTPPHRPGNGR
jgi:hypothetical protein